MQAKKLEGTKIHFKEGDKYFQVQEACVLYSRTNNANVLFDIKVKECELKHSEDRMVPADDHSKKLKKVSYYDLIPIGRKKKYVPILYESQLIDNYIIKDVK